MVVNFKVVCFTCPDAFLGERETGEAGNMVRPKQKCNASWSLYQGRLARETFANKWRGLCCEQNAGVESQNHFFVHIA